MCAHAVDDTDQLTAKTHCVRCIQEALASLFENASLLHKIAEHGATLGNKGIQLVLRVLDEAVLTQCMRLAQAVRPLFWHSWWLVHTISGEWVAGCHGRHGRRCVSVRVWLGWHHVRRGHGRWRICRRLVRVGGSCLQGRSRRCDIRRLHGPRPCCHT